MCLPVSRGVAPAAWVAQRAPGVPAAPVVPVARAAPVVLAVRAVTLIPNPPPAKTVALVWPVARDFRERLGPQAVWLEVRDNGAVLDSVILRNMVVQEANPARRVVLRAQVRPLLVKHARTRNAL